MSTPGIALFLFCAFGALLSAIGTVVVRSPIRAAMCLLTHVIALSGLFLTLHAHLLAALQVLIYAGAVVVLFVFVIMMIGPGVTDTPTSRGLLGKTAAASMMAILTFALAAALGGLDPARTLIECGVTQGSDCVSFGSVIGFSLELYIQDLVPFELIGALLTVAIVGAIAVARGRNAEESAAIEARASNARAIASDAAANTTGGE
jgi:NADH-quinone oxidoreductase subunit J